MADASDIPSAVESNVNTPIEKSSELLAPETVDSPADNVTPTRYRLFNRQKTIHEVLGGGMTADVILWRRSVLSIGVLVTATAAWYLFERSGYTFLSLISTIILLLVAILFIWANAASLLQRPLPPLPELELSEEIVNEVAASMRVRINDVLAVAHDIALGKDIKLFAKAVIFLWLFSIFGGWFNFLTLVYIGLFVSLTIPALYNKYEDLVDRNAEIAHKQIVKQYRNLDANVLSKIPRGLSKEKKMQ